MYKITVIETPKELLEALNAKPLPAGATSNELRIKKVELYLDDTNELTLKIPGEPNHLDISNVNPIDFLTKICADQNVDFRILE